MEAPQVSVPVFVSLSKGIEGLSSAIPSGVDSLLRKKETQIKGLLFFIVELEKKETASGCLASERGEGPRSGKLDNECFLCFRLPPENRKRPCAGSL